MSRHGFVVISMSLLLLSGVGACTSDDSSIVIINNMAPPKDMMTVLTASETGPFASPGTLDLAVSNRFIMIPLMKNFAGSSSGKLTVNRTFFGQGFEVTLDSPDPAVAAAITIKKFTALDGFSLPPDNSIALAFTQVLSEQAVKEVRGTLSRTKASAIVTANVQAVGKMGGSTVRSNEFTFPIEISCSNFAVCFP
jgi:hypothetical protein